MNLPTELRDLFQNVDALKEAYLVGGCVRDSITGQPVKDYDIEVYGSDYQSLANELAHFGRTDLVGKSFGTLKLRTPKGTEFDFSLPRRDSKTGPGHRGFTVSSEPKLPIEEACSRRDFTFNAVLFDPRKDTYLDPFNGISDLKEKRLRHVSSAFAEDPLRVLRGMQFAGRFDLTPDPKTLQLCQKISNQYEELPKERVWHEWHKWATQSIKPSAGLNFLKDSGWIQHFPWINDLLDVEQDPIWHPEGNVWVHTLHVCDAMQSLETYQSANSELRAIYMFAALAHDFGKPATTELKEKDGAMRVTSPRHDQVGVGLADDFLHHINAPHAIIRSVKPLVAEHISGRAARSSKSIRRLSIRLSPATIPQLCTVMIADMAGRPPLDPTPPDWVMNLQSKAESLEVDSRPPEPLIQGKDLIQLGIQPGPEMGSILKKAFEAQIEGIISNKEEALSWLQNQKWFQN